MMNKNQTAEINQAYISGLERAEKIISDMNDAIWNGAYGGRVPRCIVTIGDCLEKIRSEMRRQVIANLEQETEE